MIGSGFLACRRHRSALVDFVDHGERGPRTPAALAHLDRCERCRVETEATALMIVALRRLGDEAARAEVPTSSPRPSRRAVHRRRPPVAIAGTMLATAFAGLLAIPTIALRAPAGAAPDGGSPDTSRPHQVSVELVPEKPDGSARVWISGEPGITLDAPVDPETVRFDTSAPGHGLGTPVTAADDHSASGSTDAYPGPRHPVVDSI